MAIVIRRSGFAQHSSMCIHLFTSLVESGILEIERGQISGHFFKPFVAFSPTFLRRNSSWEVEDGETSARKPSTFPFSSSELEMSSE